MANDQIQFTNGKILFNGGQIVFNCECCAPESECCLTDVDPMFVTFTGVTRNAPEFDCCDDYNTTTFELAKSVGYPTFCRWNGPGPCGNYLFLYLNFGAPNWRWDLEIYNNLFQGNQHAFYQANPLDKANAKIDCTSNLVLPYAGLTGFEVTCNFAASSAEIFG